MKKKAVIFLLFLSACSYAIAAPGSGGNDNSLVRKGDRAFKKAKLGDALAFYLKALAVNPQDCYANFQAGAIYYLTDSAKMKSLSYFENTIKYAAPIKDDTIIDAYYYLGNCYILKKDYNAATNAFQKYLSHLVDDKVDAGMLKEVKRNMDVCKQAPQLIQRSPDSASFIINGKYQPSYIKNLGSLINTPYPEYAQVLLDKDSTIIFTSKRPASQQGKRDYPTGSYYEDIFISRKDNKGQWALPSLFSTELNMKPSRLNLASVCVSGDDKTLFVFYKGLMYESHKSAFTWSKPERIGKNIKSIKKFMPSVFLSYDGKKLLLVSDRKGGYGGRDIYISTMDDKGIWSVPQNLGADINTPFDEDAPFLLPDNKTLFFSSKGHNGLGGYDIFKSVLENGKWSTPVNLGVPVNSPADDIFFTYDTTSKKGYFSSSRINEGYGDMDLYSLSFNCDNIDSTILKGKIVLDSQSMGLSATITLKDIITQKTSEFKSSDTWGTYSLTLKPDVRYAMRISVNGYVPYSLYFTTPHQCDVYNLYQIIKLSHISDSTNERIGQNIDIKNGFYRSSQTGCKNILDDASMKDFVGYYTGSIWVHDSSFKVSYSQQQIDSINPKKGISLSSSEIKLLPTLGKNPTILFELNSSKIASSYHSTLDSIAKVMHSYTKIKLQINGYADNTGKEGHNQKLSVLRAKAVEQYLVKKGVKLSNIQAKGKGVDNPAAPNDGTHNYLNRRTEIILIQ